MICTVLGVRERQWMGVRRHGAGQGAWSLSPVVVGDAAHAEALLGVLRDSRRRVPVLLVSSRDGDVRRFLDADMLAGFLDGLVSVCIVDDTMGRPLKDRVPKNVRLHGDACRVISPGAISPEADYPVFIRNTRVSRSLLTVMIVSEVLGYYTAEIRRIIEHEGMERP